jgi:hypothetical protein
MENLNAEQIKYALSCRSNNIIGCMNDECAYFHKGCRQALYHDALALINQLTEENERLRGERAKFFEYKHGTLVRNALVLTKNKKEFDDFCGAIKADTVREMLQRIKDDAASISLLSNPPKFMLEIREDALDQIAKEILEDKNEEG